MHRGAFLAHILCVRQWFRLHKVFIHKVLSSHPQEQRMKKVNVFAAPKTTLSLGRSFSDAATKGKRVLCVMNLALVKAFVLVNGLRPEPHHPPHYLTPLSLQHYSTLCRQCPEKTEPRRRKRTYMQLLYRWRRGVVM